MRRAQPDIFKRKIVITIPPWAILPLTGGVIAGLAIPVSFHLMADVISTVLTALALIQMIVARRMLKRARWDIHRMLRDIGNEDIPEDAEEAPPIRILKFPARQKAARNGADSVSG